MLAAALAARLETAGRRTVITREPGGGGVGDEIRRILLDPNGRINPRTEVLLFAAARAYHVDSLIAPALAGGAIVICDRFSDSTTAYQGYARGLDLNEVAAINGFATAGLRPDLTLLLDLPVEVGISRQRGVDRISSADRGFHERVRQGYLAIARAEPDRVVVLDASKPFGEVLEAADRALSEAFGKR